MLNKLGYHILLAITWPMQLFPLGAYYWISDILSFFVHRVFRYRVEVVKKNLKNAFPEKTELERRKIEKQFYRNFSDIFIETLYFTHINVKKNEQRLLVNNPEVLDELIKKQKSIVCLTGHFGNWEFVNLYTNRIEFPLLVVYKKLSNKVFDDFFRFSRERLGAMALEMSETVRHLLNESRKKNPFFAYLISDQRPQKKEMAYWMTFLNQDTPVLTGPEKIAKKIGAAVIWIETYRLKRGHYAINIEPITEDPNTCPENEITEKQMRFLEKAIQRRPDQWLWSHNRWKHQRI